MSKYARSLAKESINLISIFGYLNFVDNYENSAKSKYLLVISPDFNLNLDLQSFFLYLQTFELNLILLNKVRNFSITFCKHIYENQLHANTWSI